MTDREDAPASPPPGAPIPTDDPETPTAGFRRLQTGPQTAIDMAALAPDEREQVRVLGGNRPGARPGRVRAPSFIPVYYRPSDEGDAIALFADLNAHKLAELDLDHQNVLARALPVELYTRILAAAGRIRIKRSEWVIREAREDGTWWLINPEWYANRPDARYDPGPNVACVPPTVSLEQIYHDCAPVIAPADLRSTPLKGGPEQVLRYFVVAESYHCRPDTSPDGDPIVHAQNATPQPPHHDDDSDQC